MSSSASPKLENEHVTPTITTKPRERINLQSTRSHVILSSCKCYNHGGQKIEKGFACALRGANPEAVCALFGNCCSRERTFLTSCGINLNVLID